MKDLRLQGPYRKYIPYNIFQQCGIGHLNTLDYIFAFLIVITNFTLIWKSHSSSFWNRPWDNNSEQELSQLIQFYLDKAFYIHELPPFTIQFYSIYSKIKDRRKFKIRFFVFEFIDFRFSFPDNKENQLLSFNFSNRFADIIQLGNFQKWGHYYIIWQFRMVSVLSSNLQFYKHFNCKTGNYELVC